jgi:hypothetical protein
LFAQASQLAGVVTEEASLAAAVVCLGLGGAQGSGGEVDAGGVEAESGGHEGVFARSAADVENPAPQSADLGQGEKRWLGPSDVPGRRDGVEVIGLMRCQAAGAVG